MRGVCRSVCGLCFGVVLLVGGPSRAEAERPSAPAIESIVAAGGRVIFIDSSGTKWSYRVDPWELLWSKERNKPSATKGEHMEPPEHAWSMKAAVVA